MASPTIKAVVISAGVAFMALFLKISAPMAADFALSHSPPIIWSSILSWLEPSYLFVVVNVIIAIIVASSSNYGEDDNNKIETETESSNSQEAPPMRQLVMEDVDLDVVTTFPPPNSVPEVEKSEEKDTGLVNGGDDTVVLKSKSTIEKSENVSPAAEEPLISASSGHRKPVKASPKGGKRRKALRVAKPKRQETTMENTWKMITEEGENSTSLTGCYRRSDTFGVGAGEVQRAALRKSETFRDVTNHQKSKTVKPLAKMKKEVSPSREELNRRVEAFIKKCKEERLQQSLRLDEEVA